MDIGPPPHLAKRTRIAPICMTGGVLARRANRQYSRRPGQTQSGCEPVAPLQVRASKRSSLFASRKAMNLSKADPRRGLNIKFWPGNAVLAQHP